MKAMEPRIEICGRCDGRGTVHAAAGWELSAARRAAGLSMAALGRLLGVKRQYINQLEKGRRTASPVMVERWFAATKGEAKS